MLSKGLRIACILVILAVVTSAAPQAITERISDAIRRSILRVMELPSQVLNRFFSNGSTGQSAGSASEFVPGQPLG